MPFGSLTAGGGSSAISICWISRYSRTRLSPSSRFRSASAIAYEELTSVTSVRFHDVRAGDASARQAAQKEDIGVEECAVGLQRLFGATCGTASGSRPRALTARRAIAYSALVAALFRRNSAFRTGEYRSPAGSATEARVAPRFVAVRALRRDR